MAQVVMGGVNGLDYLLNPNFNPINMQYFQNSINSISGRFNEVGTQFMSQAQQLYDKVYSSSAIQAARNMIKQFGNSLSNNEFVYPMKSLQDFKEASFVMQRWIMANPNIRELYHAQQCDGYSNTYIDMDPRDVGEFHYDYRRVMDGIVVDYKDGWEAVQYLDTLREGDRDLTLDEQVDILDTWSILDAFIKKGKEDPTDIGDGTF